MHKITSAIIVEQLKKKHRRDIWAEELRLSSGFGWQGRIDFWALSPAPSAGNLATAYEVKISRSDFRRDTHDKQRGARLFSDLFYYVTPKGLVQAGDIPDWAGLIETDWRESGPTRWSSLRTAIPAPKRDKEAPSWGLVCSLIRNANKYGGAL